MLLGDLGAEIIKVERPGKNVFASFTNKIKDGDCQLELLIPACAYLAWYFQNNICLSHGYWKFGGFHQLIHTVVHT